MDVGIIFGELRKNIGQDHRAPPGGDADMKLRALAVLQITQIALQLSVQIGLPLQVGLEQGAGLRQLQGGARTV